MSAQLPPDAELIRACLANDARAWDILIGRYEALIYTVPLRMGLPRADAEDVFQDVCLLLLHHLHEVRDSGRLAGWLISTTRREAWRLKRKRSATVNVETFDTGWEPEEVLPGRESTAEGPEAAVLALEERFLVRQAIERLPEKCRTLITLLYCRENPCTYAETAEALRIPVGSIGPSRARCLERLQTILVENGF